MSVILVQRQWTGVEYQSGPEGRRTTENWIVETDNPADDQIMAAQATGLPRRGQAHPSDAWLRCTGVELHERQGPTSFVFRVTWEVRYAQPSGHENPLERPPRLTSRSVITREPVDRDAAGRLYVNAAGEPFDPPVTREFADQLLTIERNQASFAGFAAAAFAKTICSHWLMTWPPGTQLMDEIAAEDVEEDGLVYARVSFSILRRLDGWRVPRLNHGFRYVAGISGGLVKYKQFVDADGQPLTKPRLLAANGTPLTAGADPVYLIFDDYPEKDWSALNLG